MYNTHPLANLVAMANEKEQQALTLDIQRNGQNEPAVLWKGKIVDGRCRQLACITLGIELETRELDSKLDESEVAKIVKSLNTRRNLTMTQKITSAYYEQVRSGITNVEIAKQWAISERSLKSCKYIATRRPEFIEPLFNGNSVVVMDPDKGQKITTNKINTLARIVKKEEEERTVEVMTPEDLDAYDFNVYGVIKTEAGKQEHKKLVNTFKHSPSKEQMFSAMLAELMNYKYKVSE